MAWWEMLAGGGGGGGVGDGGWVGGGSPPVGWQLDKELYRLAGFTELAVSFGFFK